MVDDAILSRETAYIYQYVTGFQPINGNLKRWSGMVTDSGGSSAELIVEIPDNFPHTSPELKLTGTTEHPRVGSDGSITTRSMQNWNSGKHVYSVIKEAKSLLSTGRFRAIQKTNSDDVENALRSQLSTLKSQLEQKRQEYQKVQSQTSQQVSASHDVSQLIEDSLIEVENEAYALEEAYDNLEIKAIEFAMNFVDARKRYYLIESVK